jgi:hypothetical protein
VGSNWDVPGTWGVSGDLAARELRRHWHAMRVATAAGIIAAPTIPSTTAKSSEGLEPISVVQFKTAPS